jgi:hypothetical protein
MQTQVVLGDAGSAKKAGLAGVAGFGVDFHECSGLSCVQGNPQSG